MYLLSVVIPCFNNAEELIRTLSKYEKCNHKEIEFVVVDDCSTQSSFQQLLEYKNNSCLNLVIEQNKQNSGPGITRNNGIQLTRGKYITFQDSDDWFCSDFFKKIGTLLSLDYDCVVFDFDVVKKNGSRERNSIFYTGQVTGLVKRETALVYLRGSTWGKVYKRCIVVENGITFLNQKRNEDLPFTKEVIAHCSSIFYSNEIQYEYFQNENSLMHNRSLLNPQNALNAYEEIESKLKSSFPTEVEAIFVLECLCSVAQTNSILLSRDKWILVIDEICSQYNFDQNNPYVKTYSKYTKLVMWTILHKQYYLLKCIVNVKEKIKRLR